MKEKHFVEKEPEEIIEDFPRGEIFPNEPVVEAAKDVHAEAIKHIAGVEISKDPDVLEEAMKILDGRWFLEQEK